LLANNWLIAFLSSSVYCPAGNIWSTIWVDACPACGVDVGVGVTGAGVVTGGVTQVDGVGVVVGTWGFGVVSQVGIVLVSVGFQISVQGIAGGVAIGAAGGNTVGVDVHNVTPQLIGSTALISSLPFVKLSLATLASQGLFIAKDCQEFTWDSIGGDTVVVFQTGFIFLGAVLQVGVVINIFFIGYSNLIL
jgi:hypothetical protein